MTKQNKGGKLAAVIVILALALPLAIAFLFLKENMNADLTRGTVDAVTIVMDDKEEKLLEKSDVAFFVSVAVSGDQIASPADDLSTYRLCEITFHKPRNDLRYRFYLSDSVNNCIYVDPQEKMFLIPPEKAAEILSHAKVGGYAVSFADYPKLTLEQGGKSFDAAKITGEWTYSKSDATQSAKKISSENDVRAVLPHGEDLTPRFTIEPDYCAVQLLSHDGHLIYSGTLEEMKPIYYEVDTRLKLVMTCDWYEDKHENFHGKLEYTFDLFYDIPTLCTVDRTQASVGESFSVTIAHSSSESVAVIATFTSRRQNPQKVDDKWIVTVEVPESVTPGEYEILLMGSDIDHKFPIRILP